MKEEFDRGISTCPTCGSKCKRIDVRVVSGVTSYWGSRYEPIKKAAAKVVKASEKQIER